MFANLKFARAKAEMTHYIAGHLRNGESLKEPMGGLATGAVKDAHESSLNLPLSSNAHVVYGVAQLANT